MTTTAASQGTKRAREMDSDECFNALMEWIRDAGGSVHSAVAMEKGSARELQAVHEIEKGTTVLQIPSKCLVTRGTIQSMSAFSDESETGISIDLHHSPQDVELALFLASQAAKEQYLAYLASLPESSAFDALPRRWSDDQLKLLTGSPLLKRIRKASEAVSADYESAKTVWNKRNPNVTEQDSAFPSLQAFSDRMAAVSSRAFEGMEGFQDFGGSEGDSTMIPLLDLCNHHRGGHNVRKNLSYTFEQGAIVVRAAETIAAGDTLRITYGAQGNAQLLLNYGFCIPNNLEPDGSSNDVLEFFPSLTEPDQVVNLRAGPKSYSYGGLVKVLEYFYKDSIGVDGGEDDAGGPDDDMDAFLDGCEEEEEEDFDWGGDGGDDGEEDDEEDDDNMDEVNDDSIKNELVALEKLRSSLKSAKEAYTFTGNELDEAAASAESSPRHYAAVLVKSEMRTLDFCLHAIKCIEVELKKASDESPNDKVAVGPEEDALIQSQVEELAKAYVQIRHSGMF